MSRCAPRSRSSPVVPDRPSKILLSLQVGTLSFGVSVLIIYLTHWAPIPSLTVCFLSFFKIIVYSGWKEGKGTSHLTGVDWGLGRANTLSRGRGAFLGSCDRVYSPLCEKSSHRRVRTATPNMIDLQRDARIKRSNPDGSSSSSSPLALSLSRGSRGSRDSLSLP